MEELMYLLKGYSLPVLLIASVVIFIVGCLKSFGLFNKLSKQSKTIVLFICDIVLVSIGVLIYLAYTNRPITLEKFTALAPIELACVLSMYSLYENVGIKKLVNSILTITIKALKDLSIKCKDSKEKAKYESYVVMAEMVAKILNTGDSKEAPVKEDSIKESSNNDRVIG